MQQSNMRAKSFGYGYGLSDIYSTVGWIDHARNAAASRCFNNCRNAISQHPQYSHIWLAYLLRLPGHTFSSVKVRNIRPPDVIVAFQLVRVMNLAALLSGLDHVAAETEVFLSEKASNRCRMM